MVRSLSSEALVRQRALSGMSVDELAEAVEVTPRTVRRWEAGTQAASDRAFGRLVEALRCDACELTGRPPGTEMLIDLRRAAGMTTEECAAALRRKQGARGLHISVERIRDLEAGRHIGGLAWGAPETLGQVVRMLAQVFGVPERVVMDAWRRSRPEDALPVLPAREAHASAERSMRLWNDLNDRQRTYLSCIFEQDREVEGRHRHYRSVSSGSRPAAEWRRMTLALSAPSELVGYTPIQERLRAAGVHDPGVGSSVVALERRGLIVAYRDRVYIDGLGDVPRTRVEMTRRGRAAARVGLDVRREAGPPVPLLSRWLWKIIIRVARAGASGVDGSLAGRGPHYLAVGQSPDGRTPSRGFILLRHPDGVTHGPVRWFLTDSGERHLLDYLDAYRALYPDIDTVNIEDLFA